MVGENEVCLPLVGQYIQFTACPDEVDFLPVSAVFTKRD